MKTNISGIMLMINEYKSRINTLEKNIKSHVYNTSIQELSGNITIMEDYKEDFNQELKEYKECIEKMTKLKGILYRKNNELKLSNGMTIQEAIVKNTNMRNLYSIYDYLMNCKNSKSRETEVNNSYFECKDINYDTNKIKKEMEKLEKEIHSIDFEISKLNSIEFEIDL